jgi:putative transposase
MRKKPFVENEYYHIYNRGVDKRKVFLDTRDYERFLISMNLLNDKQDGLMLKWRDFKLYRPGASLQDFLQTSDVRRKDPLVEIDAYCLIPNHIHFVLKQVSRNGIVKFMQKLGNSYTKYFNERQQRSGALFQGKFKSSHIGSNSMLLRLSIYVNCNSEIHKLNSAVNYRWCSYAYYLGKENSVVCKKKAVMSQFSNIKEYMAYAKDNVADFKQKKIDQELVIE